jgi:RNA polymerase sigma factor (sigma-70 family)
VTPLLAQGSRADRQFERMYRRHAGDVYRYALAVLRNPSDAEDVTQTTFMNAYRAFTQGERPQTPKNWLIAIAHNVCRQRFRQAARRPSEVELNEDLAEAFVAEESIAVEDIQRALGHLAFNQRAALVMRELEGRSYAEIAEILEVSVAAVETLIFRARRALREQLEGTLTCSEAELAISKQVDGVLPRTEKSQLRGHLRECKSCSTLARRMRAQRSAWKALGAIPLPGSLTGLFGGGGAATAASAGLAGSGIGLAGGGVAVKAAAVVATAALASGTVYEGKKVLDKPASGKAAPTHVSKSKRGGEARAGAKTPATSAQPYAPGQIKPDGQRAERPDTPPGQAKKDAGTSIETKPNRTTRRATAPGRTKKSGGTTTTHRATPTRGRSATARGQTREREKKKSTKGTASTDPGTKAAQSDAPGPATPTRGKSDDAPKKPDDAPTTTTSTTPTETTATTSTTSDADPSAGQGNGNGGGNGKK